MELGRYVERRVVQQQIMVSFADTRVKERIPSLAKDRCIFIYFLIFGFSITLAIPGNIFSILSPYAHLEQLKSFSDEWETFQRFHARKCECC